MLNVLFPHGSVKRVVASNTISQLVGKGISTAVTLLVILFVARRFGTYGYGDFVKITAFVSLFFFMVDFGVNAIYVRQKIDNWDALIGLRLVISMACMALGSVIVWFLPQGFVQGYTQLVKFGILLFLPAILFQAMITTANAYFQRMLRYEMATMAIIIGSVATIGVLALLSTRSMPGSYIGMIAILCGLAINGIAGMLLAIKTRGKISVSTSPSSWARLFIPATPLGLTFLFNMLYFHANTVILTLSRSTHDVGIYGLAFKVFETVLVLPVFFMNAVYPLLTGNKKTRRTLAELLWFSVKTLGVLGLLLIPVLWICAPMFAYIKPEFSESVPLFRMFLAGLPIFFISNVTMWGLIAMGKQKLLMGVYAAVALPSIWVSWALVPVYGYKASVWLIICTEAVLLIITSVAILQSIRNSKAVNMSQSTPRE